MVRFCTAINCIDGRVQIPVIKYLQKRFEVEYVDSVTEAAPNLILAGENNDHLVKSILEKVKISINAHDSQGIAIIGHHDCAGNPALPDKQISQIQKAGQLLSDRFKNKKVIGLWIDENWQVHEVFNQ